LSLRSILLHGGQACNVKSAHAARIANAKQTCNGSRKTQNTQPWSETHVSYSETTHRRSDETETSSQPWMVKTQTASQGKPNRLIARSTILTSSAKLSLRNTAPVLCFTNKINANNLASACCDISKFEKTNIGNSNAGST
jgi:hypothetical protein